MTNCSRCGVKVSDDNPPSIFEAARLVAATETLEQIEFYFGVACGCAKKILSRANVRVAHEQIEAEGSTISLYAPPTDSDEEVTDASTTA